MLERYPNKVKIVVKHFPLNSHRFAFPAAMGAMAAHNQGKFFEFHTALMKNYNALNDEKIESIAKELQLDMPRWKSDRKSPENRALIIGDINEGRRIGVRGTPSAYVNGKRIESRQLGDLMGVVARELSILEKGSDQK